MKLPGMLPFRFIAVWLAVLSRAAHGSGDGLSQQYCSGENTASDFNAGKCSDTPRCNVKLTVSSLQHI